MKEQDTSSAEQVSQWEQEIREHVAQINRIKEKITQPERRTQLVRDYVHASVACSQRITQVMGQLYALRVLCDAYSTMSSEQEAR